MHHHHFNQIDSTNNWAKANAHTFDRSTLTVITADEQTGGRGCYERKWLSPPKQNLYMTFCFFIEEGQYPVENMIQILALSVVDVLQKKGFDPKLKWPNDILLSGKKVGGILCETLPIDDKTCVVVGLGLNVNAQLDFLEKIDQPATSLSVESKVEAKIEEIREQIQEIFQVNLKEFFEKGIAPFIERYRSSHRL